MKFLALPMTPITAYSFSHILIVLLIFILAIFLTLLLNKLKALVSSVICVCGTLLIIAEIFKQFLLTYVRGGIYDWTGFSFQLCSTPMYLCILYLLMPKLRTPISDFIMVYGFIGSIASFIVPYSSLTGYLFLTIQSLLWHGILLFLSMFLWVKRAKEATPNYKAVAYIYIILSAIAILINISFYELSNGTINMFFLGPGYPNMLILNTIYEKTNWGIESLAMILASLLTGWLVYKIQLYIKCKFI